MYRVEQVIEDMYRVEQDIEDTYRVVQDILRICIQSSTRFREYLKSSKE